MSSFAKFEIKCDEIGFSRMHMIPIDSRGYVHQLAEDLEKALELYSLRVENHKLKQEKIFPELAISTDAKVREE